MSKSRQTRHRPQCWSCRGQSWPPCLAWEYRFPRDQQAQCRCLDRGHIDCVIGYTPPSSQTLMLCLHSVAATHWHCDHNTHLIVMPARGEWSMSVLAHSPETGTRRMLSLFSTQARSLLLTTDGDDAGHNHRSPDQQPHVAWYSTHTWQKCVGCCVRTRQTNLHPLLHLLFCIHLVAGDAKACPWAVWGAGWSPWHWATSCRCRYPPSAPRPTP